MSHDGDGNDGNAAGDTAGRMPTEIGGYRIQRLLGSGGMAAVYAALQQQPRRTVALKVMRSAGMGGEAALRRFKREIEILGRLNHPYIAQVYAAGVHEDAGGSVPYFVMEYVPGGKTLLEYAAAKELSLRDRLKLFVKVCAAVEHGHQRRIIHRDLKPGNILIDEQGEPRIIDYGVAYAVEIDAALTTMAADAGRLVGTIQYMAPEQLDVGGADLDARCDVYALGAVLYKLVTGRSMHDLTGLPVLTAVQVVKEETPARPSAVAPAIKGDLETIIRTAIAKDRMRRYRSAGSLGRDIIRYLGAKPIKAKPAGRVHRMRLFMKRRRTELLAAAVVAIVILVAAATVWRQQMANGGTADPDAPRTPTVATMPAASPPAPTNEDTREPSLLSGLGGEAVLIAVDGSGNRVAAMDHQNVAMVWNVDAGEAVMTGVADHDQRPMTLRLMNDGRTMMTAGRSDGRIVLVDVESGTIDRIVRHTLGALTDLVATPSRDRFIAADSLLSMHILDQDGRVVRTIRSTRGQFERLAAGGGGSLLAAATDRGEIGVWSLETGEHEAWLDATQGSIEALAIAADGRAVIALDNRGLGIVWRRDGGPEAAWETRGRIASLGVSEIRWVAIDADAPRPMLAVNTGETLRVWSIHPSAEDGEPLFNELAVRLESTEEARREHDGPAGPGRPAVSGAARLLIIGTKSGPIRVLPVIEPPPPNRRDAPSDGRG